VELVLGFYKIKRQSHPLPGRSVMGMAPPPAPLEGKVHVRFFI